MCARTPGILHALHAYRMTARYAKRTQPLLGGMHLLVRARRPRSSGSCSGRLSSRGTNAGVVVNAMALNDCV
ncbi:hypothetical protein HZS92_04234 [Xanthomonas citri pv. citri]|nr:hypothetical protein HZS92_04234 [Xanthomonas citri pv. citri]QYF46924.1 hypothetical protein HZS93_04294 [Xanthomonas citri]